MSDNIPYMNQQTFLIKSIHTSGFWWLVYFFVLLSIGLSVRDIASPVNLSFTLADIAKGGLGLADPTHFAHAAQDIASSGWVSKKSTFVFNLWPPGFSLLEAALVNLFGPEAPLVLILLILSAALCTLLLGLIREFLLGFVPFHWAAILPLSIVAFPVTRVFLLEPMGLVLGEAFAIEFFLSGLFLFLLAIQKKSLKFAFYAGCFLALAAYFRSQFELFLLALSVFAIFLIAWKSWMVLKRPESDCKKENVFLIRAVIVLLIAGHALTAPWRYYHWTNHKTLSWVTTSQLVYLSGLKSDDVLNANHGSFVVAGGGNLACKLEPTYCNSKDPDLFRQAFIQHPLEWSQAKFSISGDYWFSPVSGWVVPKKDLQFGDWLFNGIFLICVLSIFPLLVLVRKSPVWPVLFWFNLAVFSANLAVFTLVHFEVRYFYFLKLYSYFQFVVLFSMLINDRRLKAKA